MNISNFLNKENVSTLWDVISDEDMFKILHRDAQSKILNVFSNNIKGFFDNEKSKTISLIDINKKYIILILNYIKNNFSQQTHNKIKILEDISVKESITYEEIQNDRKSQFEKDLGRLQEEFTNSMTLPVPEVPTFADKYEDTPISEMDKMIKEMTAKRNYEVEQINRNQDINNANNWLHPQETSIKTDKFTPPPKQTDKKLKQLQLDALDTIDDDNNAEQIFNSPKKIVTWGDDNEIYLNLNNSSNTDTEESIFKKLKRVENPEKDNPANVNEIRIIKLENEIKTLNNKMDLIIDLLKTK